MPRIRILFSCLLFLNLLPALLLARTQTDWSGGPGVAGPVPDWIDRFEAATDVAWRSIPGHLALAATPRAAAVETVLAANAGLPRSVAVGDLNGDGRDDVLTTDPVTDPFARTGAIHWWEQRPDGSFRRRTLGPDFYGATYADTVDLDADGDLDVIAAAYYGAENRNGRYAWFENTTGDGASWLLHTVAELYWGANWIDAADVDADGDLDLLGASYLTDGVVEKEGDVVWLENLDGAGTQWAERVVDGDLSGALQAHAADVDGDGDVDIVAANLGPFEPNFFHWYENLAGDGGSWLKREVPIPFTGAGYVDVGDVDGDGDVDLIGGGLHSAEVGFFENRDGTGTDWQAWFVTVLSNGRHVRLADLDGDGDLDALTADGNGGGSGNVTWVENDDGSGLFWTRHPLRSGLDLPWIAPGDLDADGKLDAVVADEDLGPALFELAWYDLTTFVSSGELTSSILDGGGAPAWGILAWEPPLPLGDGLTVEVRASADPTDLGAWVPLPEPGVDLASVIEPASRYLQYRLTLSGGPGSSPVVREIDVDALFLRPPDPGMAGTDNTLQASWDRPGDTVHFVASLGNGSTPVPGCQGLVVDLRAPRILGSAVVDAASTATLVVPVPPTMTGRTVRLQAVSLGACKVSNQVEVTFP